MTWWSSAPVPRARTRPTTRSGAACGRSSWSGSWWAASAVTGEVDVAAVLRSWDAFTSGWDDAGQVSWLESVGVGLVRGHGRIVGEREVEVTAVSEVWLRLLEEVRTHDLGS
jgi:hypothetical protein